MKKNKIIWSIVMFLIIIISLPIAYAQIIPTGSRIFFIVVNAAIIGIALFLLQAFLVPGKNPKEQTVSWLVIVIASLVIAFLFGQNGFIWQTGPLAKIFNVYVIVNALIIGIFGYFVLGLLPIGKNIKSPEGIGGYAILIFLGSVVWALGIHNSYGNKFIWQAYKEIVDFFIGPKGVLNPYPPEYRLIVFAGGFFLLSFFFNNYLITGEKANKWVNYGLAFIMSINMAAAGVSVATLVQIAEAIFLIFLARALESTVGGKSWGFNWILAAILMGWASAAAFYGTENQGLLATIIGTPLYYMGLVSVGPTGAVARPTTGAGWLSWIFKMGGSTIVIGLILLVLLFVISRGELRAMLKKRAWPLLLTKFRDSMNEGILSIIPGLKNIQAKWPLIEGLLPTSVRRLRLLFQVLADYILRIDIFHAKKSVVDSKVKTIADLNKAISKYEDLEELRYELIAYRSGGVIKKKDGTLDVVSGWNKINQDVVQLVNELNELTARFLAEQAIINRLQGDVRTTLVERWNDQNRANEFTRFASRIEIIENRLSSDIEAYKPRLEAYGAHHGLRAERLKLLDMFNLTGVFSRTYKFAKKGAQVSDGSTVNNDLTEVSFGGMFVEDGVFVEDINRLKLELTAPEEFASIRRDFYQRNRNRLRKLTDKKNITDYKNFQDIVGWLKPDWQGFLRDFSWGEYHPKSRVISDYTKSWDIYEFDDDKIQQRGTATDNDPAIDLRALANPASIVYLGKLNLTDNSPETIKHITTATGQPFTNPFPILTTRGMTLYINNYIIRKEQDIRGAKEKIRGYPADVFKGFETTEKTAGTFEEAEKQQGTRG